MLTELLPPRPGSGLAVDWSAVEEAWELEFPSDYKNLIARYGEVVLGDYLSVMAPDTVTPDTWEQVDAARASMGYVTADTRGTWEDTEPTGIDAEPEELVTWGVASNASHFFCWLTRGKPEQWPVLVFTHDDDVWTQHDVGMAEFLVHLLTAQPGVEMMADSPLWGDRSPSYVNAEERRRARGT
ncbi:SMI1/KNR4 family protein [Streptomyces sp. NPDC059378]|uniref:SMI1/KNR4 family protein n=1 Tax=Streptomyces sp. NPDC059378 TaxID=3346815 RepID=UPI00367DA016